MSGMVSGMSGGFQAYGEGILQKRILERQAQATEYEAQYAEEQSRTRTKQLLGRQRALYAKAGVDISSGSPLEIMASTAGQGEREALMIQRQGKEQAKMLRWYGKVAKIAGKRAGQAGTTGGIMSGIATGVSMGIGGGGTGTTSSYRSGSM
jgi:hypothetical protein